jgi:hypothetical protein
MSQHHPIQLFSSVIEAGGNGCFDKSQVGTDVVGGYDIKRGVRLLRALDQVWR